MAQARPSGYTWVRTNRGPQKGWLHHIGRAEDPGSPCGHPLQDGAHVTFDCPRLANIRKEIIRPRKTWEEQVDPLWRKDEGDDSH